MKVKNPKIVYVPEELNPSYFEEVEEIENVRLPKMIIWLPKNFCAFQKLIVCLPKTIFCQKQSFVSQNNRFLLKTLPKTFAKFPV